ncbi:MAG: hypothetical protein JWO73_289 [Candidatus Taylorbacteria bacterium]|nr:hypothetical protein [Candidatus Taylorbacteria bacterium]
MSNVEFDADEQGGGKLQRFSSQYASQYDAQQPKRASGMASLLIKMHIIDDPDQAKNVYVVVLILNFIAAGLIFYFYVLR